VSVLLITLAVWSLLVGAPLVAPALGAHGAALAAHAAAAALLVATRSRARPHAAPAACALALLGGWASFPAFVAAAVVAGLALGLAPTAAVPPLAGGPALWASALLAAPIFEELLYRERLLDALRGPLGAAGAVVASSALFALPHVEPWPVLGTFLAGLGLGALRARGAPVELCIAWHAGLNLASLLGGSPPVQLALAPPLAAVAGLAAAAVALRLARRHRSVTPPALAARLAGGAHG
jgi:membrane protease YdiL (CAAX protease family)